jgi:hypothetical protein
MLKVYVGVVRFQDERDFVILVDGEAHLVEEAVRRVIGEIWGEGDIELLAEGLDFVELVHSKNKGHGRSDGYVLQCEIGSTKRIGFAVEYARRHKKLEPGEPPPAPSEDTNENVWNE